MKLLEQKIEEFNLGREPKFRGDIKQATLYLVHSLDASQLKESIKAFKSMTDFKSVITCHIDDLGKLLDKDKDSLMIYTTHLALDKEISLHKQISNWAFEHNIFQLNPYNKIAKIFDDKYLFYVLMIANEIPQPYTVSLLKKGAVILGAERVKLDSFDSLAIKPRRGTEKIDFASIKSLKFELEHPAITKIRKYDDCLVQEFIEAELEFKVLYLHGKFHFPKNISETSLNPLLEEFVDLIESYGTQNEIIVPQIFTLDILKRAHEYIILEANIRPAAVYSFR
jgi:hypothetical protein